MFLFQAKSTYFALKSHHLNLESHLFFFMECFNKESLPRGIPTQHNGFSATKLIVKNTTPKLP